MNRMIAWIFAGLSVVSCPTAGSAVRIETVSGDVRVRRGLEENWSKARPGLPLEALDTVWSGEASGTVLLLEDGTRFTLGGNAILDIGDLRRVTERQMFLFLMSRKVEGLAASDSSRPIRIANVSVVRGANRGERTDADAGGRAGRAEWVREKNGAQALSDAGLTPNAVIRLCRILERYPGLQDGGEIHWMLGRAFETLNQPGRAMDAYRTALERIDSLNEDDRPRAGERRARIEAAMGRLKTRSTSTTHE
ncbi:MAG: hypothetical protein QUS35_01255 [bacterium]|nr:hypothetical protein [bacterium]